MNDTLDGLNNQIEYIAVHFIRIFSSFKSLSAWIGFARYFFL